MQIHTRYHAHEMANYVNMLPQAYNHRHSTSLLHTYKQHLIYTSLQSRADTKFIDKQKKATGLGGLQTPSPELATPHL